MCIRDSPYLSELHCVDDEPVCGTLDLSDHYFEYLKLSKDDLRVLIHQEIVNHYKEESWDSSAVSQQQQDADDASRKAALPKTQQQQQPTQQQQAVRKGRRKSF